MHAKPGAALQKRDDYLSLSLRQRIEGSSADYPLVAFVPAAKSRRGAARVYLKRNFELAWYDAQRRPTSKRWH